MKEWIVIGLLILNALLLSVLSLIFGGAVVFIAVMESKWTPTIKQATSDFHDVKVLAAEKIDPVTEGLNAVAKSVNDFRIFRGEPNGDVRSR